MSRIKKALEKVFAKERIVFWYDPGEEFRSELTGLELPDVTTLEVRNDELGIKHRVMRGEPNSKFLIYVPAAKPPPMENWLLDLLLANYEFETDPATTYVAELGLEAELKPVVKVHLDFFRTKGRVDALREMLVKDDPESTIRLKMAAVVCKSEAALEQILFSLFRELANEKREKAEQLEKFELTRFLWERVAKIYGYAPENPGVMDFLLELFQCNAPISGASSLNKEGVVLLNRWQDSAKYRDVFEILSDRAAGLLNVSHALNQVEEIKKIQEFDAYRSIDQKVIHSIVHGLAHKTLPPQAALSLVERRETKYWFRNYEHIYEAIRQAVQFLELMNKADLSFDSIEEGFKKYEETFYGIDFAYRKFIYHHNEAGQTSLLAPLYEEVERIYANVYLLKLNDRWQGFLNALERWKIPGVPLQKTFFGTFVQPYLTRGNKVFVVVSDGLRYEAAKELLQLIQNEDRYQAEIRTMLGSLPSFTQLGMASLLPHQSLTFQDSSEVFVDGKSSKGTAARSGILKQRLAGRGVALKAEEFLNLNTKTDGRDLFRNHDVIYIFHNGIDATGDKRETEARVFDAVEKEFDVLIRLLKKITAVNGTNILITSDHGFLYQNTEVAESDFAALPEAEAMHTYNRRFVIGKNLQPAPCARLFRAEQVNLQCDSDFLIVNSVHRLRVQGAGSRYVHGGASLQEIVIPLIEVNKTRKSDIEKVDVDVIRSSDRITSGQINITFYQQQAVGEKCLPRELRIGFYSRSGVLLSDVKTLRFDSAQEEGRNREKREQFIFSKQADSQRQNEIVLKMEEPIEGTNQFRLYRELNYRMQRAFESDFE